MFASGMSATSREGPGLRVDCRFRGNDADSETWHESGGPVANAQGKNALIPELERQMIAPDQRLNLKTRTSQPGASTSISQSPTHTRSWTGHGEDADRFTPLRDERNDALSENVAALVGRIAQADLDVLGVLVAQVYEVGPHHLRVAQPAAVLLVVRPHEVRGDN